MSQLEKQMKTDVDLDVGEIESTFYWIHWNEFTDDGTFEVKISEYTA